MKFARNLHETRLMFAQWGLHATAIMEVVRTMRTVWTVKDSKGDLVEGLTGASRLEVGCKVLPMRFDAYRLRVSSSYRELFDRALAHVLKRQRWKIVRLR